MGGPDWPKIMLTTSRNPANQTRTFLKALKHVLPNAMILNRGTRSENDVHILAMHNLCDYVYFAYSKRNKLNKLIIKKVYADKLLQEGPVLEFYQYIDHKIFGFQSLPEQGPLSTSLITRQYNKELIDYFDRYFFIEFDKKLPLWLAIDTEKSRETTFISFIDALTQRKIFYAEVKLLN